jgi:hypothetical protein
MQDEIEQIVTDPRLTSDAVRLVLLVRGMGPGEHEISENELLVLLRSRTSKPVYTAREVAVERGYLRFRRGGRGHANRYEYVAPQGGLCADRSPSRAGNTAPIEDADDATTPVVPLHPISPDAESAIEKLGETLHGCRDSLKDYLRRRVSPPRQSSFVHDVAGKINGLGFAWRTDTGAVVPMSERAGLMSAAINELAATDEKGGYKYPPGDPRNLRTKLGILTAQWGKSRASPKATGTDGRPPRGKKLFDDADYGEGSTTWEGLNG